MIQFGSCKEISRFSKINLLCCVWRFCLHEMLLLLLSGNETLSNANVFGDLLHRTSVHLNVYVVHLNKLSKKVLSNECDFRKTENVV